MIIGIILIVICKILFHDCCENILEVSISENTKPNFMIKDLRDILTNFQMESNLQNFHLTNFHEYFMLTNYQLWLQRSIDREAICSKSDRHQQNINKKCCRDQCCLFIGLNINNNNKIKQKFYLKLLVENENDIKPEFIDAVIMLDISENSKVNTKLNLPIAEDNDDGIYGVQTYEIINSQPDIDYYFRLEVKEDTITAVKQPALLVKRNIDREKVNRFTFKLIAKDGGNPSKTGETKIIISILDENDNEPKFEKPSFHFTLRENQQIGSEITQFKVEDFDYQDNGKVSLDFVTGQTSREVLRNFQLITNKNGASLRLISNLDYETQNKYSFYIVARDHGYPIKTSQAHVLIDVINVNDMSPVIKFYRDGLPINTIQFGRISLTEQDNKDQLIVTVKVSDEDSSIDAIKCHLDASNEEDFFLKEIKINKLLENEQTYELRSKIDFDREKKDVYFVGIRCSDSLSADKLESSNKLEIGVLDINDCKPEFTFGNYIGYVGENRQNIQVTFANKIEALDLDKGENGAVVYEIIKVDPASFKSNFHLDKNRGILKVVNSLDYETIKIIKIDILAKDLGKPSLSGTAKILVNIKDLNDNPPKLDKTFYAFEIYENEPIGTFVGQINATDEDTELDNKLIFMKIRNNPTLSPYDSTHRLNVMKLFNVDNKTGRISTSSKLDREKTSLISFSVMVFNANPLDLGFVSNERLFRDTVEVSVSITVLDRNDNVPKMVLRDNSQLEVRQPEIIFYHQVLTDHYSDKCVSFPYTFTDADYQNSLNGNNDFHLQNLKVTLKNTKQFQLNLDIGTICVIGTIPNKDVYRVVISVEDGSFNDTKTTDFILSIIVKDTPVDLKKTHKQNDRDYNSNSGYNDQYYNYRHNTGADNSNINGQINNNSNGKSQYFRNKLLYIIIGSIAAALLLLLLVILVGFRKFLGLDATQSSTTAVYNNPKSHLTAVRSLGSLSPEQFDVNSSLIKDKNLSQHNQRYLDKFLSTANPNLSEDSSYPNPHKSSHNETIYNLDQQISLPYQTLAPNFMNAGSQPSVNLIHNLYQSYSKHSDNNNNKNSQIIATTLSPNNPPNNLASITSSTPSKTAFQSTFV